MTRQAKIVLREALTLPEAERAEMESLEPEADVEAAWREEVAARVAALDAGEVETTPWESIRDRFRARLSERRHV